MVFDKVKEILVDELDLEANEIKLESRLLEDLDADSLDVVELIMALEDAFDMEIPDEDTANIKTVGDIVQYIEAKQ